MGIVLTLVSILPGSDAAAEEGPSFVENGGTIREGQHALLLYADAELLLPAVMVGNRFGLRPWLEVGLDAGGSYGLFQALIQLKARLFESRGGRFFWGLRFRTGYKYHDWAPSDELVFDDRGWIMAWEHALAVRLGSRRAIALYLSSLLYVDLDLRRPERQDDLYVGPLTLGLEAMIGERLSFFFEAGFVISVNGTETDRGLLYEGDLFPTGQLGLAYRLGG